MLNFRKFWDGLLDKTILFSFDRSGFLRHQKYFLQEGIDCKNKTALITGANSGIGKALCHLFAMNGADVIMCVKDHKKGETLLHELQIKYSPDRFTLKQADLADLKQAIKLLDSIPKNSIDYLVHNAGGMPHEKTLGSESIEAIFSSQVIAPYCITKAAIENNLLKEQGKVIFVSSGGALLQKLTLNDLNFEKTPYNYYTAYANAKRAQICLSKEFSKKYPKQFFASMHPGWVDTPGVMKYMPTFYKVLYKRLRKSQEGADTVFWLACTKNPLQSGCFWFDRQKVTEHPLFFTRCKEDEIEKLINLCEGFYEKSIS